MRALNMPTETCACMQAKEATERDAPKEVRILKWIVSLESERDREQELDKAFKPVRTSPVHSNPTAKPESPCSMQQTCK